LLPNVETFNAIWHVIGLVANDIVIPKKRMKVVSATVNFVDQVCEVSYITGVSRICRAELSEEERFTI
jgi:hypothetical protein